MHALESAGFVHLYGLSSVVNALEANSRDFASPEEELGSLDDDGRPVPERKPEAQFRPWLLMQERDGSQGGRTGSKASAAERAQELAKERGIPVAYVDKGVLNTLSGNRPHQVSNVNIRSL
jgi:hypothetical protein